MHSRGRRCRLRADACGKRGGTWLGSEQVEPWECDRGDARCRVCSGKGNVRCRSPAVSLQVTGSGWRRVPVGCGGFASFISSRLRVALVPWRWQSVVLWHSAQGPHCLAACITRLCSMGSMVCRQPLMLGGAGAGGTVGEGLGTGNECEPSSCPFSFGAAPLDSPKAVPCAGSLAALSSRVVEHSQGAVMLVRGIAKALPRFAVAKFRLWLFCIGAAEPRSPAVPGAGSPAAATAASLARHATGTNSHSLREARQSVALCPIPCIQHRFGPRCLMLCCRLGLVKAEESVSCVGTSSRNGTDDL